MREQITPELEFLVGCQLPRIFEKHFNQKACDRKGDPTKVYLAFAEATLKEYRIAATPALIKRAAKDVARWKALRERFTVIDNHANEKAPGH